MKIITKIILSFFKKQNKDYKIVSTDGAVQYYRNGKLHRKNKPAVIFPDGYQAFYKNGVRHRKNQPAIIYPKYKVKIFFENGELIQR